MMERVQFLIYLGVATFSIVVFIAVVLIRRQGNGADTAEVLKSIEGMRMQQSSHQDQALAEHRGHRESLNWLKSRWDRFTR